MTGSRINADTPGPFLLRIFKKKIYFICFLIFSFYFEGVKIFEKYIIFFSNKENQARPGKTAIRICQPFFLTMRPKKCEKITIFHTLAVNCALRGFAYEVWIEILKNHMYTTKINNFCIASFFLPQCPGLFPFIQDLVIYLQRANLNCFSCK